MTNLSLDKHPRLWWIAVSAFFATNLVTAALILFKVKLSWDGYLIVDLALTLAGIPGFFAAFFELAKVDTEKRAGRILEKVLVGVILVFGVLFGSRSINNMLKVLGLGIPFYSIIRGLWIETWLIGSSILVLSGAIARKYGLTTNFEEPSTKTKSKWTVGGIIMMTGFLLVFGGFFIAFIDPLALEGLLATVSGLILFPIGRLVWKRSKNKNRETSTQT